MNDTSLVPTIIMLGAVVVVLYLIFKAFQGLFGGRGKIDAAGPMVCPHCGTRGSPATATRGSTGVELILWLCLILPGLIYSMWRLGSKQQVCPSCRQPGLISVNTPRGQQLLQQFAGAARAQSPSA